MTNLTGGKRKMCPTAAATATGGGGRDGGVSTEQRQRLDGRLCTIQGEVATLRDLSASPLSPPPPSPPFHVDEDEDIVDAVVSGDVDVKVPGGNDAPGLPAAYTDFVSVSEPCTVEDVLEVNAKSAPFPDRREANEEIIRRRGGGKGEGGETGGGAARARRGRSSHATFPAKLHDILSRPDMSDVIAWLPHGRAWRIVDQNAFIDRVMPAYFSQSKIASFMRQVNGWGFVRVTRGDSAAINSYYSEFFLRGKHSLVRFMERKPADRDALGPEPNFARYEAMPPNPDVDVSGLVPLPPSVSPVVAATLVENEGAPQMGQIGHPMLLNAFGAPCADQWSLQQHQIAMRQHQLLQEQQQLQLQAFQMRQNFLPQQSAPGGQLVQQQHAASFPPMPAAFPQEIMPTQVPSDAITPPDFAAMQQGQCAPQQNNGYGVPAFPQGMPELKVLGAGAVTPPDFAAAQQGQQQFVPQNATALPREQFGKMSNQGDFADLAALSQQAEQLASLQQMLQNQASQGQQQHQQYQQAPIPLEHQHNHLQQDLQHQQQGTTNYQLLDPTPLPEGKALQVTAPSAQMQMGFPCASKADMFAPLEADPFADEQNMSGDGMDVDMAGIMGGSLENFW